MRKTKKFVATILSLGMMLACSVTSFAAELPAQDHDVSVSVESAAARYSIWPGWENKTCDVTGDGVALRREPNKDAERVGLLYQGEGAWVVTSGEYHIQDGYIWMKVTDSSIGYTGWVAKRYLKVRSN
ncbi:MAG: SH3 domain-containing protein [Lachnospiraceae bacterium]|nr:SH3 domain-containing protein [Lachnospiraceae bacterium]